MNHKELGYSHEQRGETVLMHEKWSPDRDLGEAVGVPALQTESCEDNCCRIQLVILLRSFLPPLHPCHTSFKFTKNCHVNISLYHWLPLVFKLPFFPPLCFGGGLVLCLGFVLPMVSQTIHPYCPPAIQLVSSCLPLESRGHATLIPQVPSSHQRQHFLVLTHLAHRHNCHQ